MCPAHEDDEPSSSAVNAEGLPAVRALSWACRRLHTLSERAPPNSANSFHRAVSVIRDICNALAACEAAGLDGAELRQRVAPAREIHGRSPFIRRLQEWPRGYAGDFETTEWLWRADNRAKPDTFAYALERYALTSSIAQQHRNKVVFQGSCVLRAIEEHPDCKVLSIACGSSPDIRGILSHIKPGTEFVLCDGDREALLFSAEHLGPVAHQCRFVHGMVPRVLRQTRDYGPYHLICAGGLFDYLPDRLVSLTLGIAWKLLAPGGRMVFTNIGAGNPFRVWLEYMADWKLIERSEQDVERLCRGAGISAPLTLERDSTGLAILASTRKA